MSSGFSCNTRSISSLRKEEREERMDAACRFFWREERKKFKAFSSSSLYSDLK